MQAARNTSASPRFRTGSIFWTHSRVRVTALSRQIHRHRWEAGMGKIATEMAAPASIIEHHPATLSLRDQRNAYGSLARGPRNRIRKGCPARTPNGFPARTPVLDQRFASLSRLSLGEREPVSRVRFAAPKTRALDTASRSPEKNCLIRKRSKPRRLLPDFLGPPFCPLTEVAFSWKPRQSWSGLPTCRSTRNRSHRNISLSCCFPATLKAGCTLCLSGFALQRASRSSANGERTVPWRSASPRC